MAGTITAIVIGFINLAAGLDMVAILYFALAIMMLIVIPILTFFPEYYYELVFFVSAIVTIHPWVVHLVSGGFQSGLAPMTYVLFGPVAALLLIGARRPCLILPYWSSAPSSPP
ncbi:MAG: hypothetical protein R3C44_20530 [Chloroflexota bacterium]